MTSQTPERMAAARLAMDGKSLFRVELRTTATALIVAGSTVEARQIAARMVKSELDWTPVESLDVEVIRHCGADLQARDDTAVASAGPDGVEVDALTVGEVCSVLAERAAWHGTIKPQGHVPDSVEAHGPDDVVDDVQAG